MKRQNRFDLRISKIIFLAISVGMAPGLGPCAGKTLPDQEAPAATEATSPAPAETEGGTGQKSGISGGGGGSGKGSQAEEAPPSSVVPAVNGFSALSVTDQQWETALQASEAFKALPESQKAAKKVALETVREETKKALEKFNTIFGKEGTKQDPSSGEFTVNSDHGQQVIAERLVFWKKHLAAFLARFWAVFEKGEGKYPSVSFFVDWKNQIIPKFQKYLADPLKGTGGEEQSPENQWLNLSGLFEKKAQSSAKKASDWRSFARAFKGESEAGVKTFGDFLESLEALRGDSKSTFCLNYFLSQQESLAGGGFFHTAETDVPQAGNPGSNVSNLFGDLSAKNLQITNPAGLEALIQKKNDEIVEEGPKLLSQKSLGCLERFKDSAPQDPEALFDTSVGVRQDVAKTVWRLLQELEEALK